MNTFKNVSNSLVLLFLVLIGLNLTYAATNVIDVTISEYVNEELLYNPLKASSGLYVDANENRSIYSMNGNIFIQNNHATEAAQDILLNITGISNIYNVTNSAGKLSYVSEFNTGSDYMILYIPDLGSGDNTTLSYNVNSTTVAPILNFTTSYSDSKIFGGLPLGVTDTVENVMNSSMYPDTCIYDINITQNALTVIQPSGNLNFTYDDTSMGGLDASNASFTANNRTINWNLFNTACLNSGNLTNINYSVKTPTGLESADDYKFINTSIKYKTNVTISNIQIAVIDASTDLDLSFQKYLNNTLPGDNASWKISANVSSASEITVNLTSVTLWVSTRNGTGTGFTNPSIRDTDTVTGSDLLKIYNPNIALNSSIADWSNTVPSDEWYFNYTFSSSPIVWMDIENNIINDGVQFTNKSITYANNSIYIKEIYLVTGYWLEIFKNITRLADNNYTVFIEVKNLGTSPTPANQVVYIYNFLPIAFNLTSPFVFSTSTWYNTTSANETLNDAIYNGTMFQYGLLPNSNPSSSSLAAFGGTSNANNTWSVTYNITGSGEFNFEDLFLTGVDPLHVDEVGSIKALSVEGAYNILSNKLELLLGMTAIVIAALAVLL